MSYSACQIGPIVSYWFQVCEGSTGRWQRPAPSLARHRRQMRHCASWPGSSSQQIEPQGCHSALPPTQRGPPTAAVPAAAGSQRTRMDWKTATRCKWTAPQTSPDHRARGGVVATPAGHSAAWAAPLGRPSSNRLPSSCDWCKASGACPGGPTGRNTELTGHCWSCLTRKPGVLGHMVRM
jgi:hypothetical protein